jgi:2-methylcitrate dehydratase PrpD
MGSMSKAYGAGKAAENGVVAARLAQIGFTGPQNIFETRDGFLQVFGEGSDGSKILENLGDPYEFISPGITLKPYPSCTCTHTTISAVLKLRAEKNISPEDVESVECKVSPRVADLLKFHRPQNKFEAKYSIQYCVATALMDGRVVIPSFTEEKIKDPEKRKLMEKVKMIVSPELAKLGYNPESAPYGSTVTIKLKTGKEYVCQMNKGPWEPETPPSWDDVLVKYRGCAELVLKPGQIDDSIGIIRDLEKSQNICHLMDIVRG